MTTVQEYCTQNNYTLISTYFANEKLLVTNTRKVLIKLTCNHSQEYKISSLYQYRNKVNLVCKFCKRKNKNPNLSDDESTIKCTECNELFPCKNKYNYSFRCKECNVEKIFQNYFKDIYKLEKQFKFPDRKLYTDFAIKINDKLLLIELDEHNHQYDLNSRQSHLEKDKLVLENNYKLLRIHYDSLKSFKINHKQIISDFLENENQKISIYHGSDEKEIQKSRSFYEKIYKDHDLLEMSNL